MNINKRQNRHGPAGVRVRDRDRDRDQVSGLTCDHESKLKSMDVGGVVGTPGKVTVRYIWA